MNDSACNDECFYNHSATLTLCGYDSSEDYDKVSTKPCALTPILIIGNEPSNSAIVRVTLYGDNSCSEAFFRVDALRDMIDHAAHGRGLFR
jgi:hypothetical protein